MSRVDTLALCQDLCTNQADATSITKFYDEIVSDLGHGNWLIVAELISTTAGTFEYNPPDTIVDFKGAFYDDRWLYRENLRALEALNPHWRDERGTPRAYVIEDESNHKFKLYPTPDRDSKDFIFMFGSPLGLDFPTYAVLVLMTELREDLPKWLEMPVAFEILAREFARESDHTDQQFAEACRAISGLLLKMVGP
jgi:hypothetical protein